MLDQLLIDIGAHQIDGLFLQVFGLRREVGGALLLNFGLRLGGGDHTPHLIEGIHVEGQVVQLALIVGHRGVGVAVEGGKPVHIVPHSLVVGVENMGAIAVDVDALHIFGIDVAGNVAALVHHQAGSSGIGGFPGKNRAEQAGADDQIIILFHVRFLAGVRRWGQTRIDVAIVPPVAGGTRNRGHPW